MLLVCGFSVFCEPHFCGGVVAQKSMIFFWICEKLGVSSAGIYRDFLGDISNL